MTYDDLLHRLIADGIEAARRDYAGADDRRRAKLAGSIDGFEDCRGKQPSEILGILNAARKRTHEARIRLHEGEIRDHDYWRVRCREAEVEWMANCVSAVLVNQGLPPIVAPTARAMMAVARIVGVKNE